MHIKIARAINNSALQAQNVQTALKTAAEDQQQIATLRLGIGLPHTFFGSDEEGHVGDMSTFTLFNEKKHMFLSQLFSLTTPLPALGNMTLFAVPCQACSRHCNFSWWRFAR